MSGRRARLVKRVEAEDRALIMRTDLDSREKLRLRVALLRKHNIQGWRTRRMPLWIEQRLRTADADAHTCAVQSPSATLSDAK